MQGHDTISRPPIIVIRDNGSIILWQAAISLSDSHLTKTSRLNVRRGSAQGTGASAKALANAYEAICELCKLNDVPPPPLNSCIVET
ncbi:MAG: hypothetical protein L6Q71_07335 [Planctomycetes bacterium]|nr:hypothetical protein [Planctomycetota bacterium]NUQ34191.1 hypothetical protein [Planctomycetaceae bacterium]